MYLLTTYDWNDPNNTYLQRIQKENSTDFNKYIMFNTWLTFKISICTLITGENKANTELNQEEWVTHFAIDLSYF